MDIDVNRIVELKSLIDERDNYSDMLSQSAKEKYIKGKLGRSITKPTMPEKKENTEKIGYSAYYSRNRNIAIIGLAVFIVKVIVDLFQGKISVLFIALSLIALGVTLFFSTKVKDEKKKTAHWSEVNKEVTEYNDNEYPKLMAYYKRDLAQYDVKYKELELLYSKEWDSQNASNFDHLNDVLNKIEQYRDLIPEKYDYHLDRILDIIESHRASTMSECFNVLSNDLHAEDMLNEARRKNAILEKQYQEQVRMNEDLEYENLRHNREMERQASRQSEIASKQASEAILCTGCPKYGACLHQGWRTTECGRIKK